MIVVGRIHASGPATVAYLLSDHGLLYNILLSRVNANLILWANRELLCTGTPISFVPSQTPVTKRSLISRMTLSMLLFMGIAFLADHASAQEAILKSIQE